MAGQLELVFGPHCMKLKVLKEIGSSFHHSVSAKKEMY
jgi:hypothetical protein